MAAIAKVEKNRHSSARLGSVETEGNVLLSRTERPGSHMALVANFADNRNRWQMWACFDLRHAPLADDVARERGWTLRRCECSWTENTATFKTSCRS